MKVTSSSVLIFITHVCFVQSDKPSNTLTELSKPTNLTCCSERGLVVWKSEQSQICYGLICQKTGHSIDNSTPGCFHLIINSTSIDAAGLYQCNENATGNVSGAYLVVYNFSCSDNFDNSDDLVEGDRVKFQCSVSWWGKWPFEIRWLNEHGIEMQKNVISELIPIFSNSLEIGVSRPNLPPYTVRFSFLNNEITDPDVDKSCPSVSWNSTSRSVKYPPSNIKLSCPGEILCERRIDDTINCSADGHPIPELHWLDWDDKKIASGSVLELKSVGSYGYRCVAANMIRGKIYKTSKNIVVNVNSKPDIGGSQCAEAIAHVRIITLIVLVLVIIVIIALVIVGCLMHQILVKMHALSTPQQMVPPPEQIMRRPQQDVPRPVKAEAEVGKPSFPPGKNKYPKVGINRKEYNNSLRSAKSMMELGIINKPESGGVFQTNDSEAVGSGIHPETEGASLLTQGTIAETEAQPNFFRA